MNIKGLTIQNHLNNCVLKHLIDNTTIPVSGIDGLESLRIGLAAKKSFQENRPVKLNEIE